MRNLACVLAVIVSVAACGDDGGGPDAAAATCEAYCDRIATNCSGGLTQYSSRDQCLSVCGAFDPGAPGATSGNSLECRFHFAGAALADAAGSCAAAGPGGDGRCGSDCDGLCTIVLDACTDANEAYATAAECLAACGGFDDGEPYDATDTSGDTLACRLYHATVATIDPVTHCGHTLPVSATCN